MFAALWLLGSMVLDYLTPKELTVYMIAAATAPAVIGTALSYYLRFPQIDFLLILATLWLVAALPRRSRAGRGRPRSAPSRSGRRPGGAADRLARRRASRCRDRRLPAAPR